MSDLRMPGATVGVSLAGDRDPYLWVGSGVFDVVLRGDKTDGALSLLDFRGGAGDTTPLHLHRSEAEVFYVLEGAMTAWAGDDVLEVGAGGAAHLPAGLPHAFRCDVASRVIVIATSGGFGDFVSAAGMPSGGTVPATWEFDLGRVMAAAPQHEIEILGPPPGAPAQRAGS